MAIARLTPQSGTNAVLSIRQKIGDPATNAAGNSIPATLRRHSDDAILAAYNATLTEMQNELQIQNETDALLYSDTTYTEGTSYDGMRLPSGIAADGIFAVVDITSPLYPVIFPYLPPSEIDKIVDPSSGAATGQAQHRFYSLLADSTATASPPHRLKIRPDGTGRSIRIWYVAPPLQLGLASDANPLASRWNDVACSGAAVRLLAIDDEVPEAFAAVHATLWRQFLTYASRQRNAEHIGSRRIRSC